AAEKMAVIHEEEMRALLPTEGRAKVSNVHAGYNLDEEVHGAAKAVDAGMQAQHASFTSYHRSLPTPPLQYTLPECRLKSLQYTLNFMADLMGFNGKLQIEMAFLIRLTSAYGIHHLQSMTYKTSLMLNGQMNQSLKNDHRAKFESSLVSQNAERAYDYNRVNNGFQDRTGDNYVQPSPVNDEGSSYALEGATNPEYVVTADDVDKFMAVECIPMDDRGRQLWLATLPAVYSAFAASDEHPVQFLAMAEEAQKDFFLVYNLVLFWTSNLAWGSTFKSIWFMFEGEGGIFPKKQIVFAFLHLSESRRKTSELPIQLHRFGIEPNELNLKKQWLLLDPTTSKYAKQLMQQAQYQTT
ncbi:hypothetical protein M8C21_025348, partial [Ambrosia artemisiifolia]